MAIIRIIGKNGREVEVDEGNNLLVNNTPDASKAGYVTPVGEAYQLNSAQSIERLTRPIDVSQDYRLRIGQDGLLFQDKISYSAVDYSRYVYNTSTMTIAFSSNKMVLNSSGATAANNLAQVRTKKHFPFFATFPVYCETWFDFQQLPVLNTRTEIGAAIWPGNTNPIIDGVVLRFENNVPKAVVSFNGAEIESDISASFTSGILGDLAINKTYHLLIIGTNEQVVFYIDKIPVAKIDRQPGSSALFSSASLQLGARLLNTGVAATAAILRISEWNVQSGDMASQLPLEESMVSMGHSLQRRPPGASGSSNMIVRFANSAAPTLITALSNTALPTGPTHTDMVGGQILINAIIGAETDYILFGYQVPAASSGQPGRSMVITGIIIDMYSIGAAVGANGNVYEWALDVNSSALSLVTGDALTGTLAGERIYLGQQVWLPGASALTSPERISVNFKNGIVVHPGLFWKVVLRIPVGLATASLQFRGVITPIGYML